MKPLSLSSHNKLTVILASNLDHIPDLIAELALLGPVTVLDGGNCFPAYRIAHLIRRKSIQVQEILKRILIRRAFTCYQMLHLLESAASIAHPHIILNPLSTFQDDQVTPREADRLLILCLSHTERLSLLSPVVMSLDLFLQEEKSFLLQRICDQADQIFSLNPDSRPHLQQMTFFQTG